jgi:hypothetical protein
MENAFDREGVAKLNSINIISLVYTFKVLDAKNKVYNNVLFRL